MSILFEFVHSVQSGTRKEMKIGNRAEREREEREKVSVREDRDGFASTQN